MAQDTVVATAITASGTTWAQLKTGGARVVLDNLVAANVAKANPTTAATVSATGGGSTGGSLAAGTYYFAYTFVDPFGETLVGGRSTSTVVAATNIPRVTLPSLPTGVQSINLYVGTVSGSETLYATGISATTFDCSYAAPTDPSASQPPANSTGAAAHHALLYSILDANGSVQQQVFRQTMANYLSGYPMDRRQYFVRLAQYEGILRAWLTMFAEIRTLVVANQGTLAFSATTGGTQGRNVRTFS